MASKPEEISIKGLDGFSKQFLGRSVAEDETEYIRTTDGQKASAAAVDKYHAERSTDFIKRSGHFTSDLIAFIMDQKNLRDLTDTETVFGLALTNINLRNAFGSPQGAEKSLTAAEKEALLESFDKICEGAQDYWDANT
jgi:hypothetical protein